MDISAIDHVAVVVDDIADAIRLLQGTLGLDPVDKIERAELTAVFLACGDIKIELIEIADPEIRKARLGGAPARIEHIAFTVDSIDGVLDQLKREGIRPTAPPRLSGTRRTFWTDPATTDGVMYQFVER